MMKEMHSFQCPLSKIYNFLIARLWESRESDYLTQSLYYEMALCLKDELFKEKMNLHPEEKNLIEEKRLHTLELSSNEIDDFEWIGFLFLPVFSKEEKIARGKSILKNLLGEEHAMMSILIEYFKNKWSIHRINHEYLLAGCVGGYLDNLGSESIQSRVKQLYINYDIVFLQIHTVLDYSFMASEYTFQDFYDILKEVDIKNSYNTIQRKFDTAIHECWHLVGDIKVLLELDINGYLKFLKIPPKDICLDNSQMYSRYEDLILKVKGLIFGDKVILSYVKKFKIYPIQKILDQIESILLQKKAESSEKSKKPIFELKNSQKKLIQLHNEIVEIAKSVHGLNFSRIEENEI